MADVASKINSFLASRGEEETFIKGSGVSNNTVNKVIQELGKNISVNSQDANSLPKEYLEFLNVYGEFYGQGIEISSGTLMQTRSVEAEDITSMANTQRGFECRYDKIFKKSEMKSCWQIACVGQQFIGDHSHYYYINVSNIGKGYIYKIGYDQRSKIFAKSFLEFLDKFFEEYEIRKLEDEYEERAYKLRSVYPVY